MVAVDKIEVPPLPPPTNWSTMIPPCHCLPGLSQSSLPGNTSGNLVHRHQATPPCNYLDSRIKNPRRDLPTYQRPFGKDLISGTRGLQFETQRKCNDVCSNHQNKPVPTKMCVTHQQVHPPCTGVPCNSTPSRFFAISTSLFLR